MPCHAPLQYPSAMPLLQDISVQETPGQQSARYVCMLNNYEGHMKQSGAEQCQAQRNLQK